jgi:small subunit ribosomal protein S20
MANIKSQIKRNRQNEMRRVRNKGVRSRLKTLSKRFTEVNGSDDRDGAERAYRDAARELDKAAAKGIIHKNKAANQKARLAKRLRSF